MQEDSGHHVYTLPFTDICQALSEILHMKLEMYFKEIILNTVDIKPTAEKVKSYHKPMNILNCDPVVLMNCSKKLPEILRMTPRQTQCLPMT